MKRIVLKYPDLMKWRESAYMVEFMTESPLQSSRRLYVCAPFLDQHPDALYDSVMVPTLRKNEIINRFYFEDHRLAWEFKIRFG